MEKHLSDLEVLTQEAASFAGSLAPRTTGATLVTLSGELGAGKTSFTQGLAAALGVTETVTSPTFVLEKVYALEGQKFSKLVHIDAYRLDTGRALEALGFSELMKEPDTLIVLEWPERVSDTLPPPAHAITLTVPAAGGRTITYA